MRSLLLLPLGYVLSQTLQGCYKIDSSLSNVGSYPYQSTGYCNTQCSGSRYAVFALTAGDQCLCGNALPSGGMVDNSNCNQACSGYPSDNCGGSGYASVWLTGVGTLQGKAGGSGSSSSSTGARATTSSTQQTSTAPQVVTITTALQGAGTTITQTLSSARATGSSRATTGSGSQTTSGSSGKGGISGGAIAGIVIGVLVLLALGLLAFFLVRRRRMLAEDAGSGDYKRQIEPATTMRSNPVFDTRLEPTLAAGRNSSESLADDQDYSRRKVLRVVN